MKLYRKMFGFKTRAQKAADLDYMAKSMHQRLQWRRLDALAVTHDEVTQEFVIRDTSRRETRYQDRKDAEKHISRFYHKVREQWEESCHH